MRYTLRDIPEEIDRGIRAKAEAEGKTLNQAALEVLRAGLGMPPSNDERQDLSELVGSWTDELASDESPAQGSLVEQEDWM